MTKIEPPEARASSEWDALAVQMARNGFVVVPAAVEGERLDLFRRLADNTPLTQEADYPGSDKDVGYVRDDLIGLLRSEPPLMPLLERLLGDPVFLVAWQRVGLPNSQGAPWHQDWEREFWPSAVNLALYLDDVTPENGPTLVVPGTQALPHPVFDDRSQPREEAVLGPAGTVALL
jgi:ectoine hydroxylase-related dioxygenase (phytanoyl-CoA dioxygenase family)